MSDTVVHDMQPLLVRCCHFSYFKS